MIEMNKDLIRKQALLTGTGVALQFLGSMCLCAASILAMKEIALQIKKHMERIASE